MQWKSAEYVHYLMQPRSPRDAMLRFIFVGTIAAYIFEESASNLAAESMVEQFNRKAIARITCVKEQKRRIFTFM